MEAVKLFFDVSGSETATTEVQAFGSHCHRDGICRRPGTYSKPCRPETSGLVSPGGGSSDQCEGGTPSRRQSLSYSPISRTQMSHAWMSHDDIALKLNLLRDQVRHPIRFRNQVPSPHPLTPFRTRSSKPPRPPCGGSTPAPWRRTYTSQRRCARRSSVPRRAPGPAPPLPAAPPAPTCAAAPCAPSCGVGFPRFPTPSIVDSAPTRSRR
jgi:hypothetical protein